MKLKALVLAVIAGVAVAGPGANAQNCAPAAPDVSCPSQTVGVIQKPVENQLVSGFVRVIGFALDGNLVSNVDIYIDGTAETNRITPPGGLNINLPRPEILQAFPQFAGTAGDYPGFEGSFKASLFSNGAHTIYVRITDVTGCCYFLAPRNIRIDKTRNEAPFGTLDYPLPDSPVEGNGVLRVVGWALDDVTIDHVEVYIDGLQERQAVRGIYRPDVAAYYPDATGALTSGFLLYLDSTRLYNGVHEVRVMAVDNVGQKGLIGTRRVQVFNNSPNLPPFGEVEYPLLNATWVGNCSPPSVGGPSGGDDIQDTTFLQYVNGWALDTSVVVERGGVSHVFLEVDGVPIQDTRGAFGTSGCHHEPAVGNALVDCYGYYRPDIEILYPGFQQAPNCGFSFLIDVGVLITQRGFKEGCHILQIKAADKEDQITLLKELPVCFECAGGQNDRVPLAFVDDPSNYKFVNGVFPVKGWALDADGVFRVRILIDGFKQIDAVTGLDYAQYGLLSPDVALIYPGIPGSSNARFLFNLDTTKISNSEHDLLVEVEDTLGRKRSAGTRRFLVDNNTLVR